jgi:DNA-binding response OmpR family regulator
MQKKENEQEEKKGQKKKIMIVDDDVDITNSFGLALEDSGLFEVDTYNDPLVALSNYRPNSYDLLLLDIQMPKMNGFELCINIKKIDSKVKVRFISEYDVDELREQFPSLELDCFNSKDIIRGPIEVNKLIERVQTELLT